MAILEILIYAALIVSIPLALLYGVYWIRAYFAMMQTQGRVSCPHCAELIQPEARVCRFCQREIESKNPRGLFQ